MRPGDGCSTLKLSNIWAVCLERNASVSTALYLGGSGGCSRGRRVSILSFRTKLCASEGKEEAGWGAERQAQK